MDVAKLLRELRLMKGQHGYRYVLAWLAVLIHVAGRPAVLGTGAWLIATSGRDDASLIQTVTLSLTSALRMYLYL